jgi:hypothetical protein
MGLEMTLGLGAGRGGWWSARTSGESAGGWGQATSSGLTAGAQDGQRAGVRSAAQLSSTKRLEARRPATRPTCRLRADHASVAATNSAELEPDGLPVGLGRDRPAVSEERDKAEAPSAFVERGRLSENRSRGFEVVDLDPQRVIEVGGPDHDRTASVHDRIGDELGDEEGSVSGEVRSPGPGEKLGDRLACVSGSAGHRG